MSTTKIHGRDVNESGCPIVEACKIVGDFWVILILRQLLSGPQRFSELERNIAHINKATLNTKLKLLLTLGMIEKTLNTDLKPHYSLLPKGKQVAPVIAALEVFGTKSCA